MNDKTLKDLGSKLISYCKKFNIPLKYIFEILEDQKVTPMIRGKGMEYNAYIILDDLLSKSVWSAFRNLT